MAKRILMAFGILTVLLLSGCWVTVRNGEHNGQITAVEQQGLIWTDKYAVYVKSDISSSQEEVYCLESDKPEVLALAKQLSKDRKRVTIHFHDEFVVAPWRCGDSSAGIIDWIELVQ